MVRKFLVNEAVEDASVYRTLQIQYVVEKLSRSHTYEWCNPFKYGCRIMIQAYWPIFLWFAAISYTLRYVYLFRAERVGKVIAVSTP